MFVFSFVAVVYVNVVVESVLMHCRNHLVSSRQRVFIRISVAQSESVFAAPRNAACFVVLENGLLFYIYVYGSMSRRRLCIYSIYSPKKARRTGFIVKIRH